MKSSLVSDSGLILTDREIPQAAPNQVLVKVAAAALNRADLAVVSGGRHGSHGGPGTVPGMEWAGTVQAVGAEVPAIKVGDRVMCSGMGGYAEYAVTDWGRVMPIAPGMSFQDAVTMPVAIQTMHNALVTAGGLKHGESVLIQGASSGVGLMAMKIARLMGARRVIGTSTHSGRRARLAEFGADAAIDTLQADWPEQVHKANGGEGVDLVIDQLSGTYGTGNLQACKVLGRIVNVGRLAGRFAEFDFDLHALKRISYIGVTFRTRSIQEVRDINEAAERDLGKAIAAGQLVLPIDRVFAFDDLAMAFEHMRTNQHFGKIVIAF
ncbi:MAG: zinc-binding alcohol dehydrogenase family protein [Burkholderiales bacterium]|jgi:NADPH2:quinone reductase